MYDEEFVKFTGVLWTGSTVLPGAVEFIKKLQEMVSSTFLFGLMSQLVIGLFWLPVFFHYCYSFSVLSFSPGGDNFIVFIW